jgi:hypothetical protein
MSNWYDIENSRTDAQIIKLVERRIEIRIEYRKILKRLGDNNSAFPIEYEDRLKLNARLAELEREFRDIVAFILENIPAENNTKDAKVEKN